MASSSTSLTLNCSRISTQGGLKAFAFESMQALMDEGYQCQAVVPANIATPAGVERIATPTSLAGAADLSLLRPLRWLAYSRFRFPVPKDRRILCTTHHVLPGRTRQVVTVHDIRPCYYPDTPVQAFYFRHMLPRALRKTDGVLTVSETSRRLIAEAYKIPIESIAVVPNVIAPPKKKRDPFTQKSAPFLLTVGASWPHKNVESLLSCHRVWAHRYTLTVIAGEGQYKDFLKQRVRALHLEGRVNFLENVSAGSLDQLYSQCSALVAPSRMEGFGLPALEAMARSRPAIVANIPVFHELYGEHAIYVDTQDCSSWEQAFAELSNVSPATLIAAEAHALTYSRERMAVALRAALTRFWGM